MFNSPRSLRHLAALLLTLVACHAREPGPWHEEPTHRWRALAHPGGNDAGFSQVDPSRSGIAFANTVRDSVLHANRTLANGSGVAIGDVDGDGRPDIYLARLDGPNALYVNQGGWKFREVAAERGAAADDRFSAGVAFADVDGDGDLDLVVTAVGGPSAVFVNDGTGHFTETELARGWGSTTAALADVDGDGDLDLYIANYKLRSALDEFSPAERSYQAVVDQSGDVPLIRPEFEEHYRLLVDEDLGMAARSERGEPDLFYLNDGTGTFTREPLAGGRFRAADGGPLGKEPDYFGLSARFHDVDGDGRPDLYVCNDFDGPDLFWLNEGDGTFREATTLALRTTSHSSMGVDFSDVDRDGHVDFLVVDMLPIGTARQRTYASTASPLPKKPGDLQTRLQIAQNTLFLNRGDGTFAQIGRYAGIEASEWSWATIFVDVDLDGFEDVLIASGYSWDIQDMDVRNRLARRLPASGAEELAQYAPHATPNYAFRNRGDLTFERHGVAWGFSGEPDIAHGMAVGDLDGDGDLDVVINRFGPAVVLQNETSAPRIAVTLAGDAPNTRGVGAEIRVLGGPVAQTKQVTAGGTYLSGSDQTYVFAAGDADSLTIEVRWPRGALTTVRAVPGRVYEIREAASSASPASSASSASPARLFEDISSRLSHHHVEAPFDDHARQPLLPNRLSQLGPGVTWADADGDGDDDLVVAAGRTGRLTLLRNDGGRFTSVPLQADRARFDQTTVLALPAASGLRFAVGQSVYEAPDAETAGAAASVLGFEAGALSGARELVGGQPSSVGPLAAADVDGDGDLDLFVGRRVIPTAYPVAPSSELYTNEGGRFTLDTANQSAFQSLGMVSAVQFSDIDGDGDPDLLVALEWGPIHVFENRDGRFVDRTEAWGLASLTSRWNGIATGDFDGDGRVDVIATSWGRNTVYAGDHAAIRLYAADIDRSGTLDLLEARRMESGEIVIVTPYDRMMRAIPVMQRVFPSASSYAEREFTQTLEPTLERMEVFEAVTLDHHVFLHRGDRFEAHPLPPAAQLAPAFGIAVADLDGDGREDVFLAQNFTPTAVGVERYDAGRGLLLLGDSAGGFVAVGGTRSGIEVYGDGRGAAVADFDGDGRTDLAVTQNSAETKLYRNVGAKPGLRVRLRGPRANPHAVGAQVRLVYGDGQGPMREIQAGSGYWSQHSPVIVLGMSGPPTAVWVRWPDGTTVEAPLTAGQMEIDVAWER